MMDRALKSACGCPVLLWFGGRNKEPGLLRFKVAVCLVVLAISLLGLHTFAASEHHGQVNFGGLPVPGVTVTAIRGEERIVAITDQQGIYTFADLEDGVWTFRVEMLGFATQTQEIKIAPDRPNPVWELMLLPFEEITRGVPLTNAAATPGSSPLVSTAGSTPSAATPPPSKPSGSQSAAANSARNTAPTPATPAPDTAAAANDSPSDLSQSAATGLLVNGSVNNGGASAFAQAPAFGNNRRGTGVALQRRRRNHFRHVVVGRRAVLGKRDSRLPSQATTTCRS